MKRAIVVGASSGIGKATALKLANSGWDVIVHGFRKSAETHALAEQIQSLGRKSHALIADLSQTAQVQNLVEQAWSVWDGLDAWLHLAGADILTGDARHANFDQKLQMLWSVDVQSTITACRGVGQKMTSQGHGSIVTMGWDQAETGMDGDSGEQNRLGRHRPHGLAGTGSARNASAPLGTSGRYRRCLPFSGLRRCPIPHRPGLESQRRCHQVNHEKSTSKTDPFLITCV